MKLTHSAMNVTDTTIPAPAWATQITEEEDLDEPPELQLHHPKAQQFPRTIVRRNAEQPASLLTKAFKDQDQEDFREPPRSILTTNGQRRRSMASNISIASTADLTSDTGFTSPSRTNTPSPPIPEMAMLRLNKDGFRISPTSTPHIAVPVDGQAQEVPKEAPRKRCIQFACAAKPQRLDAPANSAPTEKAPIVQEPRRSSIRFACSSRPKEAQSTPSKEIEPTLASTSLPTVESPSTPKKTSALSAALAASPSTARRVVSVQQAARPKFLRANSTDLVKDSSQFHEFASGTAREDDWIRQDNNSVIRTKLTINDTLSKENNFRRLADEAEEEALLEENEDEEDASDDENEDEDDERDEEDDEDDEDEGDEDGEDEDLDHADGYSTDEETGFADSDDDDEDENMILWTPGHANATTTTACAAGISFSSNGNLPRRPSAPEQLSDSSTISNHSRKIVRRTKPRNIHSDHEAHDLPDSTDFVCGTLDEDRPLEEAYMSCLAARRTGKLRLIPQDIDPSFPTSDPENDDDDDDGIGNRSEETVWMAAKMDGLDDNRSRRRRKSVQASPRKYHSPPPTKRRLSPGPKARPRSPKPLFGRSPRRMRSPAPRRAALTTPLQSPRQGEPVRFKLAGRPDVTHTKSLPRAGAIFRMRSTRITKRQDEDIHVRGAVDIVKGLEKKRQRRKEKFYQKYCNKARRGQIPERKTQPGRGAERMKEIGLLMAGKKDPGNYVLSI